MRRSSKGGRAHSASWPCWPAWLIGSRGVRSFLRRKFPPKPPRYRMRGAICRWPRPLGGMARAGATLDRLRTRWSVLHDGLLHSTLTDRTACPRPHRLPHGRRRRQCRRLNSVGQLNYHRHHRCRRTRHLAQTRIYSRYCRELRLLPLAPSRLCRAPVRRSPRLGLP